MVAYRGRRAELQYAHLFFNLLVQGTIKYEKTFAANSIYQQDRDSCEACSAREHTMKRIKNCDRYNDLNTACHDDRRFAFKKIDEFSAHAQARIDGGDRLRVYSFYERRPQFYAHGAISTGVIDPPADGEHQQCSHN